MNVCVNWSPEANSVTKIWGIFSKPQSGIVQFLNSVSCCYWSYLSIPAILILDIATTQIHPLTWASPVYALETQFATWVHSPACASLLSVPSCWLPTMSSLSLLVPVVLCDNISTNTPPPFSFLRVCQGGPKLFYIYFCCHHLFLLLSAALYHVSFAHTSNEGHSATHCATVVCCRSM